MNKSLYLLIFAILFYNCSNKTSETSTTKSASSSDSIIIEDTFSIHPEIKKILPLFTEISSLPLKIDSVFLHKINKFDSLTWQQIDVFATTFFKHQLNDGAKWDIQTHRMIDSLKQVGKYTDYVNNLDIGMTKYCKAFAINRIPIDTKTFLLIWAIQSSSYEACPYSAETACYMSVIYKGNCVASCLLGDELSAGDPPVSMFRLIESEILEGAKINMHLYEENDEDMDAPQIEITNEKYEFTIKDSILQLEKEDIQKPKKIKRPNK